MSNLYLKDYGKLLVNDSEDIAHLRLIANKPLKDIIDNDRLLVYPHKLGAHFDGIEDNKIIALHEGADDATIEADDMLGFIGIGDTHLTIGTRFTAHDANPKDDFLLHYMLKKTLSLNIFRLLHPDGNDTILDVLCYMFADMLANALQQGLLKRYTKYERNDANVSGIIDIARHIRHNMPFNGKIAYTQRRHSADNIVIHLIRHTIEYIRTSESKAILSQDKDIKNNVATIVAATPNYNHKDRRTILNANRKRNPHPYFTKYEPLVRLCIAILKHKRISYSAQGRNIYGILFSGSWLWESYLYKAIFEPLGFIHADNRRATHKLHIFEGIDNDGDVIGRQAKPRYPDYLYAKNANNDRLFDIIADAKYRSHVNAGDRDNLHQLITYMYITKAPKGMLIFPIGCTEDAQTKNALKNEINLPKRLNGYGGLFYRGAFEIPDADSYGSFVEQMQAEEERLRTILSKKIIP